MDSEIIDSILTPDIIDIITNAVGRGDIYNIIKTTKQIEPIKPKPYTITYEDPLSFKGTIHKETPKAYMFKIPLNTDKYSTRLKPLTSVFIWMPKSMVNSVGIDKWKCKNEQMLNTNLQNGFDFLKKTYPNIMPNKIYIQR